VKHYIFVICALVMSACSSENSSYTDLPAGEALSGGATTYTKLNPSVSLAQHAYSQPATNLGTQERALFAVGNSFFTSPWVSAPSSVAARDGLGPLYNAAACQDCHIRDGRGRPPSAGSAVSSLLRISLDDGSADPVYGNQIQDRALPGVKPEATLSVRWQLSEHKLAGGELVELRKPQPVLEDLAYGELKATQRSLRVAPPVIGLGLLEMIPDQQLTDASDESDRDSDGISGRVNWVLDPEFSSLKVGRFGWKASQPSVRQQSLAAFANDMGISSSLFTRKICSESQSACDDLPGGGEPELEAGIELAVLFYVRHLAVPARRAMDAPEVIAGKRLFRELACASCHRPRWVTGQDPLSPALSSQQIWPYTDLLLHDMGEGLADGVREGDALGSEWRTPPLWGIHLARVVGGKGIGFLHDGRARNFKEAILWHGGEAKASAAAFAALPEVQRGYLVSFLKSL
jgi:CxxC motif-containing protein (DUF1111 family)